MAEEQRCQEGNRCANNCGFFGSPATSNLCSKCHRDNLKTEQDLLALFPSSFSSSSSSPAIEPVAIVEPVVVVEPAVGASRCTACRKKLGLTGFKCRCGAAFCGAHRPPEKHGCRFDYKAAGREAIARSNPVVQAEKLRKF